MRTNIAILAGTLGLSLVLASSAFAQGRQPGIQPGGMGGDGEYGASDHASAGRQLEKMRARRLMMQHAKPQRPMQRRQWR